MLQRMFNSRGFVDVSRTVALAAFVGTVLGGTTFSWALPGTINLSLLPGAVATASSSRPEGIFDTAPQTAIDGNRDGNYGNGSVFYRDANPADLPLFYQVDLGTSAYIERVQVLRRTDADDSVLNNLELTVFEDNGAGQPGAVAWQGNYLQSPAFEVGTWGTTDPGKSAPDGAFGRFVKFTLLDSPYWVDFAEFEVIGSTSPLAFNESDNIAAGKPVTTSSLPGYGALLESGNDGNIDGSFGSGLYRPVYHSSNFGVGEYWQVDLTSVTQLDHLQLFARGDNYTTSQYKVTVFGADGATVAGSYIVDNNPLVSASQGYDHVVNTAGISGQFIRVETTNSEYLAFSELRLCRAGLVRARRLQPGWRRRCQRLQHLESGLWHKQRSG